MTVAMGTTGLKYPARLKAIAEGGRTVPGGWFFGNESSLPGISR
jgi:hypothetical protein